jgi:hypothetical protein
MEPARGFGPGPEILRNIKEKVAYSEKVCNISKKFVQIQFSVVKSTFIVAF